MQTSISCLCLRVMDFCIWMITEKFENSIIVVGDWMMVSCIGWISALTTTTSNSSSMANGLPLLVSSLLFPNEIKTLSSSSFVLQMIFELISPLKRIILTNKNEWQGSPAHQIKIAKSEIQIRISMTLYAKTLTANNTRWKNKASHQIFMRSYFHT